MKWVNDLMFKLNPPQEGDLVFIRGGVDSKATSLDEYHLDILGFKIQRANLETGLASVLRLADQRKMTMALHDLTPARI